MLFRYMQQYLRKKYVADFYMIPNFDMSRRRLSRDEKFSLIRKNFKGARESKIH